QAYSLYENAHRNPDIDSLLILSDTYGISLDKMTTRPIREDEIEVKNFQRAMNECHSDILYLTDEEIDIVMTVRDFDKDKKRLLNIFLDSQK
ncbi:MAG: helix-turn-helix transcriptional regulator, partial [Hespellia sp.]|nr:helix-turn-helix transcriptional regulator [Hespellia sp.]